MSKWSEQMTVQARIFAYAQEIGWSLVSREKAEQRRGIRRYHDKTRELFVPQQLFTATGAIGFSYGVTWNTMRRNIFASKKEDFEPQISRMGTDKSSASNITVPERHPLATELT